MVTHWSPFVQDHHALHFFRLKVEVKVASKMHPLLPNCSEELCGVIDALSDCRLPNSTLQLNASKDL